MEIKLDGKFLQIVKDILGYPPYLVFVFVGAVFVSISLSQTTYFDQVWIFFLYSVVGSIWRYIEKDIDGGLQKYIENKKKKESLDKDAEEHEIKGKNSRNHLVIISIYHIGNILLFLGLLYYLKLI